MLLAGTVGLGSGARELVSSMGRGHAVLQNVAASLWTALAVAGVFVLARRRAANRSAWFAVAVSAVFAFGTSAWSTAAFQMWQHGPSLAAVAWTLVLVDRLVVGSDVLVHPLWSAAATGAVSMAALAVRPTNALVLAATGLLVAIRCRAVLGAYVVGVAAVGLPWLVVTRLAYGRWLQPYGAADRIRVHDAYLEAMAANLVSSGRGLVVFSPIVVLSLVGAWWTISGRPGTDDLQRLCLGVVVLHWLAIAGLPHWTGGHSFGPRLFTDVLPCLVVLALPVAASLEPWDRGARPARATAIVMVLAAASIVVHAQSTLVISTRCWNLEPVDVDDDYRRAWSLSDPMVASGYRDLVRDPSASIRGICTRSEGAAPPQEE